MPMMNQAQEQHASTTFNCLTQTAPFEFLGPVSQSTQDVLTVQLPDHQVNIEGVTLASLAGGAATGKLNSTMNQPQVQAQNSALGQSTTTNTLNFLPPQPQTQQ